LGVRYVLEGSVRKAANRVRITAQLIDGESGNHIWAERYDRDLEDIFEVQNEITQTVVGALGPELSRAEQERARLKAPDNLGAWDLYQRGLWYMWRFNKDDTAEARRLFQQATGLDPNLSLAYAAHAYTHLQDMYQGITDDRLAALEIAMQLANQALVIDNCESFAYVIRAIINLFRRDHPAGRNDVKFALEINSSDAMAHMVLGLSYNWCNDPDGSLKYLDDAERLSPKDPALWLSLAGRTLNCLIEERFEDADAAGKRAIAVPNAPLIVRFIHAASLGHLGRTVEARDAIETMISINPKFSMKYVDRILPTNEPHVRGIILEGLQKAGAPEG
jgi:adenylate cyclase